MALGMKEREAVTNELRKRYQKSRKGREQFLMSSLILPVITLLCFRGARCKEEKNEKEKRKNL
jgi:hypothetical protein